MKKEETTTRKIDGETQPIFEGSYLRNIWLKFGL